MSLKKTFSPITWLFNSIIWAIVKFAQALFKALDVVLTPIWRGVTWSATLTVTLVLMTICVNILARFGLFGGAPEINSTRGFMQMHETTTFKFRDPMVPQINMIRQFHGQKPIVDGQGKPVMNSAPVIVLELNLMSPDHPSPSEFATLVDEIVFNLNAGNKFSQIVVVLDSPGGSVIEYGAYYAEMIRLRQTGVPITFCVDQIAASGGYMIAMTGDVIVASPFAMIGSVGVVAEMINYNGAMELVRIKDVTITSGEFKRDITPTSKLTDEKIAHRKAKLVAIHKQFQAAVVKQRKLAGKDVDPAKALQADTWTAQETMDLNLGLVDQIGTSHGVLFGFNQTSTLIYMGVNKKPGWQQWMKTAATDFADHLDDKVSHTVDERLQGRETLPQLIAQ